MDVQHHDQLVHCKSDDFQIYFTVNDSTATSLPMGLFGSVEKLNRKSGLEDFEKFWKEVIKELKNHEVSRVEIVHPPEIYKGFIPEAWLSEVGFSALHADINHHILLQDFSLHNMEEKKLAKLKDRFSFEHCRKDKFGEIYDFIAECRQEKGIVINITKFKLGRLLMSFPDQYDLFCGYIDGEMASAVITLKTAKDVAYYFLPATPKKFKKDSPMVGLMMEIARHFKKEVKFLDLGISSIQGEPQQGLINFKERMGGVRADKKRWFMRV